MKAKVKKDSVEDWGKEGKWELELDPKAFGLQWWVGEVLLTSMRKHKWKLSKNREFHIEHMHAEEDCFKYPLYI